MGTGPMSIPSSGAGRKEVDMCLPGRGLEGPHRERGRPPARPECREKLCTCGRLLWLCLLRPGTGSGRSPNSGNSSGEKQGEGSDSPKFPGRVLLGA